MKAVKIRGFPEYYITDNGEVYSRKIYNNPNGRIRRLKKRITAGTGYACVSLSKESKVKRMAIHRLVAEAFLPNINNKPCINHRNGIRDDNRVENLEWCSYSENNKHAFSVLKRKPTMLGRFGKEHNRAKKIYQIKDGIIIAEYYGALEAERNTGVNSKNIQHVLTGRTKTASGFVWKY